MAICEISGAQEGHRSWQGASWEKMRMQLVEVDPVDLT